MELIKNLNQQKRILKDGFVEGKWNDDRCSEIDNCIQLAEIQLEKEHQMVIDFTEWVSDNWIKDPFPRKEFNDDIVRYTNIASIDYHSDDKLKIYTIEELYSIYTNL